MKRFTETTKWRDPWFRKLSPLAKLLWIHMCDNCDNAGVIDLDIEAASFEIGAKVGDSQLAELSSRLYRLHSGKILIKKFTLFQFGELKDTSVIHRSVLKLIQSHNIPASEIIESFHGMGMGSQSHLDKDKEKEKGTDKEKEEVAIPESLNSEAFLKAWSEWKQHRRDKRKPMTSLGAGKLLKQLEMMGEKRAIRAIDHSIANGWQGIFEPKEVYDGRTQIVKPNPRNQSSAPVTQYGANKPRAQREREEADRRRQEAQVAGQMGQAATEPLQAQGS